MTRHLDTSREAFHSVIPKLSDRQAAVLKALEGSCLTNAEIAERLGWPVNRVTPRCLELRELGQVRDAGKRRCRVTGRTAYQWEIGEPKVKETPKTRPRIIGWEPAIKDGVTVMRPIFDVIPTLDLPAA